MFMQSNHAVGREARRNKKYGVSDVDMLKELDEAVQRKNREKMMEAQREKQEIMEHYRNYDLGVQERLEGDKLDARGFDEPEIIRTRAAEVESASRSKNELFGSNSLNNYNENERFRDATKNDDTLTRRKNNISRRVFDIFNEEDQRENERGTMIAQGRADNRIEEEGIVNRRRSKRDEVYERKKQLHLARQRGIDIDEVDEFPQRMQRHSARREHPPIPMPISREDTKDTPSFFDKFGGDASPKPKLGQPTGVIRVNDSYEEKKKQFAKNLSNASSGGLFDKLGHNEQPKGRVYGTVARMEPSHSSRSPVNQDRPSKFDYQFNDSLSSPTKEKSITDMVEQETVQRKREQARRALEYQREIEKQIQEKEERQRVQRVKEKDQEEREHRRMIEEQSSQRRKISFDEPLSQDFVTRKNSTLENREVNSLSPRGVKSGALKYSEPNAVRERETKQEKQRLYQLELAAQAEEQRRAKQLQKEKEREEERKESERIKREVEEEKRRFALEKEKEKETKGTSLKETPVVIEKKTGEEQPPTVNESLEDIMKARKESRKNTLENNQLSDNAPEQGASTEDKIIPIDSEEREPPRVQRTKRERARTQTDESDSDDFIIEERIITRVPKSKGKKKRNEKSEKDVAELLANYLQGLASNFNAVKEELDSVKKKINDKPDIGDPPKEPPQEIPPEVPDKKPKIQSQFVQGLRDSIELGRSLETESVFLFPTVEPDTRIQQPRPRSARRIRTPRFDRLMPADINKIMVDSDSEGEDYFSQILEMNLGRNRDLEVIASETSFEKAKDLVGEYLARTTPKSHPRTPNTASETSHTYREKSVISTNSSVNSSVSSPLGRRLQRPRSAVVEQSLPSHSKFISNLAHGFEFNDSDSDGDTLGSETRLCLNDSGTPS